MDDLWFEDFTVGRQFTTGGATLSEGQILDFALRWDPQPFHVDKEAAKDWGFGGIIASGFHTLVVAFRLYYAEKIINKCSLGSPGFDELRWPRPVRPGDTISVRATVKEARPSQSKPDRGIVRVHFDVRNQHGETVMDFTATQILRKRPA
jgi:acyl dehydratase